MHIARTTSRLDSWVFCMQGRSSPYSKANFFTSKDSPIIHPELDQKMRIHAYMHSCIHVADPSKGEA
ncbi:uncharacterized protein EI90DRAFT_3031897 [Cantharellus anzutake]|uniref:uncharacterized protein n=1 Tax=Cantharellus anzutake TaxID=1750568 RepID=UPI001905EDC5|nr:uncharacterized protein EI90DRAFT_3031897 [Cantharellus anzutake]KAF8342023.1 hypothetical protein EI90DRAFT_3031897 [Cantharellus anzutake]